MADPAWRGGFDVLVSAKDPGGADLVGERASEGLCRWSRCQLWCAAGGAVFGDESMAGGQDEGEGEGSALHDDDETTGGCVEPVAEQDADDGGAG